MPPLLAVGCIDSAEGSGARFGNVTYVFRTDKPVHVNTIAIMSVSSAPLCDRQFVPLLTVVDAAEVVQSQSAASVPGPASETVTKWLAATAQLHRASASSQEFFANAAQFAVETVGLDAAWVLTYSSLAKTWDVVGHSFNQERKLNPPQEDVLASLVTEPSTRYEPATEVANDPRSEALVVAPVVNTEGELIGAVYGLRDIQSGNRRRGIRPLEARLVELLAESVAVGVERLAQETEAARARVLLEQAFSPTVADHIQRHPECLQGQLRDVTLLFADLRGFTSLAETLAPADCYRLLSEVMEQLTQVVIDRAGIVVDYYGDGLLALWNAPLDQENHADLACSAAFGMLESLPDLTHAWSALLPGELELGIGIHTGPVLVGNAGTQSRLKYGPRGSHVNVASRVQAATKELETSLLVTAATQRRLSEKFFTLRACTARLPGLEQPVELFTIYPASEATEIKSRLDQYSRALKLFEHGDLIMAEVLLSELVSAGPVTPARFLAQQAVSHRYAEFGRRSTDRHPLEHSAIVEIHEK